MSLGRQTLKRQNSTQETNGCLIIILGHGSNSEMQDLDPGYNINFRSMPFIGMNNTSNKGFTHSNSRYQKLFRMSKSFENNTQCSVDNALLDQDIHYPDIKSQAWFSNNNSLNHNKIYNSMNTEQKGKFFKKFRGQYLNDFGASIQIPHNQLFHLPKINPLRVIENPELLDHAKHDEIGGIFLIRDTIYKGRSSFCDRAHITEENNIPADFTLISDLFDRFCMTVDDISVLFSFIFIKNNLFQDNNYIIKICNIDTQDDIDDEFITSIIFNKQVYDIELLKKLKIYEIDITGLCGFIYLIHVLKEKSIDNEFVKYIKQIITTIFIPINPIQYIDKDTNVNISSYNVNFNINNNDEYGKSLSYNINENNNVKDAFDIKSEFNNILFKCLKQNNFLTSILSYACRPFTYNDITVDELFEIVNSDTILPNKGDFRKISSQVREQNLKRKNNSLQRMDNKKASINQPNKTPRMTLSKKTARKKPLGKQNVKLLSTKTARKKLREKPSVKSLRTTTAQKPLISESL